MQIRRRQKGSVIVEFSLAGIASLMMVILTLQLSIAMWNYHTLANAVRMGAQMAAVKGKGCTTGGRACGTTVGGIVTKIANEGVGVPPSQVNLTLTTASGATTTCNPMSTCLASATQWPPSTDHDNVPGAAITISARYNFPFPLMLLWPGAGTMNSTGLFSLPASSTQRIVF